MQVTEATTRTEGLERANVQTKKEFPRAIRALGYRNFRLFSCGQIISLIGTWMQTTGQSWLVLQLTHNAMWLGIDGALQFVPVLFLSIFSGVIADRLPKRKLLIATQTTYMLLAAILCLLVATHIVQLWQVLMLSTLLGIINSLDMPVRQSFMVEMVGSEALPNAIALNSSSFNVARIIGPSIAGLLIAWLGEMPLFLLNALSFIPVLAGIFAMRDSELLYHVKARGKAEAQGVFKSLSEGCIYIARTPAVFLVIAVLGVVSLFGINFNVVLPLFADSVLHVGSEGYGFISSAFGVGALIAALGLAWRSQKPTIPFLLVSALLFSIFEALFAVSHLFILSLIMIAIAGFGQISFTATANSTVQTMTPGHLRGRIMSVYTIVFTGTTPIGNLLTGGIANTFGASIALLSMACIGIVTAVVAWFGRKPAEKSLKEYDFAIHE